MAELDMSWFAAAFALVGLLVFLLLTGRKDPAPIIVPTYSGEKIKKTAGAGKKGGKKKGKKGAEDSSPAGSGDEDAAGSASAEDDASSPQSSPTAAGDAGAGKKGKKAAKVTTLKKDIRETLKEKAEAAAGEFIPEEDEEGFQTAVGSRKTRQNKRRIENMAPEAQAAYRKAQEAREDEKWEIAGPSRTVKGGNAYAGLSAGHRAQVVGRKVPAKKQERHVDLTPEEIAAKLKRVAGNQPDLSQVRCSFELCVQGTWYPSADLLATNDFDHAPQLLKCHAVNPASCVAVLRMNVGGKDWMTDIVADEPWLVTGWFTPLSKLVTKTATQVEATVFWQTGFPDAAVQLSSPAASSETLTLGYVRASPQLSKAAMKVDFKTFVQAFTAAAKDFLMVVEKLWDAVELLEAKHEAQMESNPERAEKMLKGLAEVKTKLPGVTKLTDQIHALEDSIADRWGI